MCNNTDCSSLHWLESPPLAHSFDNLIGLCDKSVGQSGRIFRTKLGSSMERYFSFLLDIGLFECPEWYLLESVHSQIFVQYISK
jgi:hypothetical protein